PSCKLHGVFFDKSYGSSAEAVGGAFASIFRLYKQKATLVQVKVDACTTERQRLYKCKSLILNRRCNETEKR
ncbi:hypothetical protein, partial [Bacteroides heparinolyticus]|uniref:hypothetical protein n=1 Tax=Prevotella heparinolytica TaxID=28113 RepID=UPI0035A06C88